jgi:hypothetical protein
MSEIDRGFPGVGTPVHPPLWRFFLPGAGSMTVRRGAMRRDVDKAAARLTLGDEHAAALQLARQYAAALDNARFWEDQARKTVEEFTPRDRQDDTRLQAVEKAVDSARVVASIGPKLLAVLTALGMTGRAAPVEPAAGGVTDDPARGKLLQLRDRRRAR